jgi:O-antigen ligase
MQPVDTEVERMLRTIATLTPEASEQFVVRNQPRASEQVIIRSDAVESVLFWIFVAGLAWVPWSYGSNDLTAWSINAVLFPGLAIIYEISILVRSTSHPVALKTVKVSAALLVAVVIWVLIQSSIWTPSWFQHPIWAMAADTLKMPVEASNSVNRDLTTLALMRLITAASVFWLALQLCRNESRANNFMLAFVVVSLCYAAYGLIQFVVIQSENTSPSNYVTSTFYNRNHYATYAGMGLVAAIGLVVRVYERGLITDGGSIRFKIATFIEATGHALLLLGSAFLIFVTLILTASRGGIIATGLGVLVWGVLMFGRTRRTSIERSMILVLGSTLAAAVLLTFGDIFFGKMAETGFADPGRLSLYAVTLRSILDAPLLGYGYGTFVDIFPMFRDRTLHIDGIYAQAHNSYLEIFQGLGLILGSLLVASIALLVWKCRTGVMFRREITVPCIATGVAFLVGVNALVDFSLQVQAVALTFMAILGAGVAQSMSSQLAVCD